MKQTEYTLGRLLKTTRNKYGISRKELSRGVMLESLCKTVEEDKCIIDKFTWDFLLSRLGMSTNIYECYVTEEEWEWYEFRMTIRKSVNACLRYLYQNGYKNFDTEFMKLNIAQGRKDCAEYRSSLQQKAKSEGLFKNIHILFLELIESYFLLFEQVDPTIRLQKLENTAKLMEFDPSKIRKQSKKIPVLSVFELEIFILMAYAYRDGNEYETARECLEWAASYSMDHFKEEKDELVKIYPYIAWSLARLEEVYGNTQNIPQICMKAMELLLHTRSVGGMVPLMDMLLKYWNEDIALSICTKEQLQKQRQYLLDVFLEYDENPYSVFPYMMIENSVLVSEAIKQKRESLCIKQLELSEGVIEPETISRFESGKQRIRWKKIQLLLQKLGMPIEKERLFLDSYQEDIVGKYPKIATHIYLHHLELARREVMSLEENLDKKSKRNRQYLYFTKAILQKQSFNINDIQLKEMCEKAIKITMPSYPDVSFEEHIMSRQEGIILNNIALLYKKSGRIDDAYKLFERCTRSYQKGKINECYLNNTQMLLMINFIGIIGDKGNHEEAIQLSKQLFKNMIRKGRIKGASGILYEILWNLYHGRNDEQSREQCKKLYEQALSIAKLEGDIETVKFLLNRENIYT